jgi:hypothetical protein
MPQFTAVLFVTINADFPTQEAFEAKIGDILETEQNNWDSNPFDLDNSKVSIQVQIA